MSTYPHDDQPHFVYRCYDAAGDLLYIGCTYNPPQRMHSHSLISAWFPEVAQVRLLVFPDRRTGFIKEREAIETERPRFNTPRKRKETASLRLLRGGAA